LSLERERGGAIFEKFWMDGIGRNGEDDRRALRKGVTVRGIIPWRGRVCIEVEHEEIWHVMESGVQNFYEAITK